VSAHHGQRLAQPPADDSSSHAEVLGDRLVGHAAEVGKLDGLLVAGRQSVQRIVDRLANHRAREVVPRLWRVVEIGGALDHHLLEAFVITAKAAAVERSLAKACHQPLAPRVAGHGRQHDEIRILGRPALILAAVAARGRAPTASEPPTQHRSPFEPIAP